MSHTSAAARGNAIAALIGLIVMVWIDLISCVVADRVVHVRATSDVMKKVAKVASAVGADGADGIVGSTAVLVLESAVIGARAVVVRVAMCVAGVRVLARQRVIFADVRVLAGCGDVIVGAVVAVPIVK